MKEQRHRSKTKNPIKINPVLRILNVNIRAMPWTLHHAETFEPCTGDELPKTKAEISLL